MHEVDIKIGRSPFGLLELSTVHIATEVLETPSWRDRPVLHNRVLVGDIGKIN